MEEIDEKPSQISRKPGKFRFRTLDDDNLKPRSALKMFSEIKTEAIEWFWDPYIPYGRITMLGGDPGAGKSFITTALAASRSRGDPLPGEEAGTEPMVTLMLSAEDDPGDTIKPRLQNLNADMTKIFVSTEDIILDATGFQAIREMVTQTGARLLIVDPIVAFLGPKVDMNRANEVRHIMKGLGNIARKMNIALVVVRHNRKQPAGAAGKAIYAGNGSIDFTAAVRSELAVVESKNGVKFLNHIKTNSSRKGDSIRYDILPLADGTGLFRWGDMIEAPAFGGDPRPHLSTKFKDETKVKAWLFDLLKQEPTGISAKTLIEMGKVHLFSQTKLEHAKKGVAVSVRVGQEWFWKLAPDAQVDAGDQSVIV